MFGLIKKMFSGLLTSIVSTSNHTKCVSLSNQKCMNQPTLITLHLNEFTPELHYYSFVVNLGKCAEVAILLMTCLVEHVFQMKQKI